MSEPELIQGLINRDPAALSALVDSYAASVYALVSRILAGAGSAQDAEECTSDVFHAAWQRVGQYDPARAPLKTWLLILAKYQALERRRQLLRQAGLPDAPEPAPLEEPQQALAEAEERQEIQKALDQLPPMDRELVYRRYFMDERVDDLARALGLTRQAADNRLWRARKALRQLLSWWQKEEVAGHDR